jgi:hypothetical protein
VAPGLLRYAKKTQRRSAKLVVEANSVLGQILEPTNLILLALGIGLIIFAVWVKLKVDGD